MTKVNEKGMLAKRNKDWASANFDTALSGNRKVLKMEQILDPHNFARDQMETDFQENPNIDEVAMGSSIESVSASFGFKKTKKDAVGPSNVKIPIRMQPVDTGTLELGFSPRENFDKFEILDNNDNFSLIDRSKFKNYDQNSKCEHLNLGENLVYFGEISSGKTNGMGNIYRNKVLYLQGFFKNNKLNGSGNEYDLTGEKEIYKGQFKNNLYDGLGTLFKDEKDNEQFSYTTYYHRGKFKAGTPHGIGHQINWTDDWYTITKGSWNGFSNCIDDTGLRVYICSGTKPLEEINDLYDTV